MVLGTALTALAPATSPAVELQETTTRAVADMSRYCTACWRNARLHPDSWGDCTQEVFRWLLERVDQEAWGHLLREESEERREFLRAIDAVKKRTQRGQRRSVGLNGVVADPRDPGDRQRADDREAVQRAAGELLSTRQQRILQLSFEGWAVQDIADALQLPAERVSDEKYKAVRKLRAHLCPAAS